MTTVAAIPAEQQVAAVSKKLIELNPGFDGKLDPSISNGIVTRLALTTDNLTDISPIRVWSRLTFLLASGSAIGKGKLADLAPLHGIPLTGLVAIQNPIVDLSPLKGMPLEYMRLCDTRVSDLTPLANLPLRSLELDRTPVVDLAPLRGLPLEVLTLVDGQVRDLSPLTGLKLKALAIWRSPIASLLPLRDMPLEQVFLDFEPERDREVLRSIKTLKEINSKPIAEFWKEIEATSQVPASSKVWNAPDFREWMKTVVALAAEQQVQSVAKKLQELNPGFDGNETHKIAGGVVTGIQFNTDNVTDISPVRALAGLTSLKCEGNLEHKGKLFDLSPLRGMGLRNLQCSDTQVSDLSPLKGMPLTKLGFMGTPVSDLSPLRGMPLTVMHFQGAGVTDLSPLDGMKLTEIWFTPKKITKGIDVIRQMKSIGNIGVGWGLGENSGPDEFWKKYDAGEFGKPDTTSATPIRKPITTLNDRAFQQWMKEIAALTAEKQVEAVAKKLKQLNPGFDGKVGGWNVSGDPKIEAGVVTELGFITDNVTDISPVRALVGLKMLKCYGSPPGGKSKLSDLLPLKGLQLTHLNCDRTQVADLSHLIGMPLTFLSCGGTSVSNLVPLAGMKLSRFCCDNTNVSDLTPLKRMPLTILHFDNTKVDDLSPLEGLKLREVSLTPGNIHTGLDILRRMPTLQQLRDDSAGAATTPKLFWKKYVPGDSADEDAGAPFVEFDGRNGFTVSRGFPDDALQQLKAVTNGNKGDLKCFTFTPGGDWIMLFDGDGFSTNNPNLAACQKLAELRQPGLSFNCVAFAPGGGWTILWNQNGNWTQGGASGEAFKKMQELVKAGSRLRSIAYGPGGAWVLMYDEIGVAYGQVPNDLAKILDNAVKKGAKVFCVAFTGSDWICLTTGGWWTSNLNLPAAKQIEKRIKLGYSPKWIAVKPKAKQ